MCALFRVTNVLTACRPVLNSKYALIYKQYALNNALVWYLQLVSSSNTHYETEKLGKRPRNEATHTLILRIAQQLNFDYKQKSSLTNTWPYPTVLVKVDAVLHQHDQLRS